MSTTTQFRKVSFRFPSYLFDTLKQRAKEKGSSLNSCVVELLSDMVCDEPNSVTMAAIEEARSDKDAGIADTSSIEAFIKSCSE